MDILTHISTDIFKQKVLKLFKSQEREQIDGYERKIFNPVKKELISSICNEIAQEIKFYKSWIDREYVFIKQLCICICLLNIQFDTAYNKIIKKIDKAVDMLDSQLIKCIAKDKK